MAAGLFLLFAFAASASAEVTGVEAPAPATVTVPTSSVVSTSTETAPTPVEVEAPAPSPVDVPAPEMPDPVATESAPIEVTAAERAVEAATTSVEGAASDLTTPAEAGATTISTVRAVEEATARKLDLPLDGKSDVTAVLPSPSARVFDVGRAQGDVLSAASDMLAPTRRAFEASTRFGGELSPDRQLATELVGTGSPDFSSLGSRWPSTGLPAATGWITNVGGTEAATAFTNLAPNPRSGGTTPPSAPPPPAPASPEVAVSGSGASFFVPLAALLALLALVAPATFRRLREVPDFSAPAPFACALERPG